MVGFDEIQESLDEFFSGLEDSPAHHLAREDAEPNLDLVEPTGSGRRESEVQPLLLGNPRQGFLAARRRPVIGDDL